MKHLILLLWFLGIPQIASANKCNDGLLNVVIDYPIEKDFPYIKVFVGKVNRDSPIFQIWRTNSHWTIPDEAFNWHYYTFDQRLKAARFYDGDTFRFVERSIRKYFTKLPEEYENVPVMFFNYPSIQKRIVRESIHIEPPIRLTKANLKEYSNDKRYYYFIDLEGNVFIYEQNVTHSYVIANEGLTHVIDIGYLEIESTGAFAELEIRNAMIRRNDREEFIFDTETYLKDYFR